MNRDELVNTPWAERGRTGDQWLTSGLRDVTLPSGTRLLIVPQDFPSLLRAGLLPAELFSLLVDVDRLRTAGEKMNDVQARAALRTLAIRAAASVKYIHTGERFEPFTMSEEDFAALPAADQEAFSHYAVGKTPDGRDLMRDESPAGSAPGYPGPLTARKRENQHRDSERKAAASSPAVEVTKHGR